MDFGITLKQPWAEFVITNLKPSENRSWKCKHRGLLFIHSSKFPDTEWTEKVNHEAKYAGKRHLRRLTIGSNGRLDIVMACGKLIGAVIMEDCIEEAVTDWCDHGVWHHRYIHAIKFTRPVAMKGTQKIYAMDNQIIQQLCSSDLKQVDKLKKLSLRLGYGEKL